MLTLAALYRPWITVRSGEGLRSLDDPVIFALNHNNSFETIGVPATLIHHRLGRMIHFLVDWMFLHLPAVGWVLGQVGPVPVYTKPARWRLNESLRSAHRGASPVKTAIELLASGRSIGIFPEGTRNRDAHTLLRGRAGLGRIVLESDAPVVPVGIRFDAASELGRVPILGSMTVKVGRPMTFAEQRAAVGRADPSPRELGRLHRTLGREVIDLVMLEIGELCGKRYDRLQGVVASTTSEPGPQTIGGAA